MTMRDMEGGKGESVLRFGGNPWVQWLIAVWILAVLLEYFNADLGFAWTANIFR